MIDFIGIQEQSLGKTKKTLKFHLKHISLQKSPIYIKVNKLVSGLSCSIFTWQEWRKSQNFSL